MHTLDKQTQNQITKTQQTKHEHFDTTHQNEIKQDGIRQITNPKLRESHMMKTKSSNLNKIRKTKSLY